MNYWNHVYACLFVAVFSSIGGYQTGYLNFQGLQNFWLGIIPYTLFITCDLDSEKSIVRRLWGPFGIIWSPFSNAGHREILHNPVWGPFILVCFLWVPITAYYGHSGSTDREYYRSCFNVRDSYSDGRYIFWVSEIDAGLVKEE
jgi:hypothetical protein